MTAARLGFEAYGLTDDERSVGILRSTKLRLSLGARWWQLGLAQMPGVDPRVWWLGQPAWRRYALRLSRAWWLVVSRSR